MPEAAPPPPAPEGCVYGPWWDGVISRWLAITPTPSGAPHYWAHQWTGFDWCPYSSSERELLRLAKENAELRASQPSEEDMAGVGRRKMTPAELHAKAQRAACWLPTAFEKLDAGLYADTWTVFQLEDEAKGLWGYSHCDLSDRMMIAFAEDRGWQGSQSPTVDNADVNSQELTDKMDEADVVEVLSEQQKVGSYLARWGMRKEGNWNWIVLCPPLRAIYASGTAPTREEAKRQAVEAARRMNNENV